MDSKYLLVAVLHDCRDLSVKALLGTVHIYW